MVFYIFSTIQGLKFGSAPLQVASNIHHRRIVQVCGHYRCKQNLKSRSSPWESADCVLSSLFLLLWSQDTLQIIPNKKWTLGTVALYFLIIFLLCLEHFIFLLKILIIKVWQYIYRRLGKYVAKLHIVVLYITIIF